MGELRMLNSHQLTGYCLWKQKPISNSANWFPNFYANLQRHHITITN